MQQVILVSSGGVAGVLARYYLSFFINRQFSPNFPWSTFIINILGSFLIGCLFIFGKEKMLLSTEVHLALSVGLLGGFTTFSAFSLETLQLISQGRWKEGILYSVVSVVLGVSAAWTGMFLGRLIVS